MADSTRTRTPGDGDGDAEQVTQVPGADDSCAATDRDEPIAADADAAADAAVDADGPELVVEDTPAEGVDLVDELRRELDERTGDLQRVTAEYANFRRRVDRDRTLVTATAQAAVVSDLLPIADDLDLANQHGDLTGPLKAVHDRLTQLFTKLGVTRVGVPGDAFNPEFHEAIQDLSSGSEKTLGTVLRPGYLMGERLIRTATVIIADPVADTDADAESAADTPATEQGE